MENVAAFGFEREDQEELFYPAVETLLTINDYHTPREKLRIIDETLELGKEAYLSMSDDFFEDIPRETFKKIIHFIIAKAYYRAGAAWEKGLSPAAWNAFYLHLNTNIIFILMFGDKNELPLEASNVIQMRDTLHEIPHDIKIPLRLERRRKSDTGEND